MLVLHSLTSTSGKTSRILLADIIPWINKASLALALYIASTHTACHALTNLTFRSCTALLSLSPVIEALKLVTVKVESRCHADSISVIEAPVSMWPVDCVRTI